MPASTSSWQSRSYSSALPSHQWIESGWVSAVISSTQAISLELPVAGASDVVAVSLTWVFGSFGWFPGNEDGRHVAPGPLDAGILPQG